MKAKRVKQEELEQCKQVVKAFEELFQLRGDIVAADAGDRGIVLLKYFNGVNFECNEIFTDSRKLFEELWEDWSSYQLLQPVMGTAASDLDYEELYERLPEEEKAKMLCKREVFWRACFNSF